MHHRIWLPVIVITSTYPAATPQPTIRMGSFFYVKIIEKNSVKKKAKTLKDPKQNSPLCSNLQQVGREGKKEHRENHSFFFIYKEAP